MFEQILDDYVLNISTCTHYLHHLLKYVDFSLTKKLAT